MKKINDKIILKICKHKPSFTVWHENTIVQSPNCIHLYAHFPKKIVVRYAPVAIVLQIQGKFEARLTRNWCLAGLGRQLKLHRILLCFRCWHLNHRWSWGKSSARTNDAVILQRPLLLTRIIMEMLSPVITVSVPGTPVSELRAPGTPVSELTVSKGDHPKSVHGLSPELPLGDKELCCS